MLLCLWFIIHILSGNSDISNDTLRRQSGFMWQLHIIKNLYRTFVGSRSRSRSGKRSNRPLFKNNLSYIIIFATGAASGYIYYDQNKEPQIIQVGQAVTLQPCFTERYKCLPLIIKQINGARQSIRMMAYSFTSQPIAAALIQAKQRGIDVRLILDKSQTDQHSQRQNLELAGIPVYIDLDVAIAHNKVIIIDQDTVLTGSYNYSVGAENRNAENIVIIKNAMLAQSYLDNWQYRLQKSVSLKQYRSSHKNAKLLSKFEF